MGPIWDRQDPGGTHVGPMNFAIWVRNEGYNWLSMPSVQTKNVDKENPDDKAIDEAKPIRNNVCMKSAAPRCMEGFKIVLHTVMGQFLFNMIFYVTDTHLVNDASNWQSPCKHKKRIQNPCIYESLNVNDTRVWLKSTIHIMTSPNGNIFRVTGSLWGEGNPPVMMNSLRKGQWRGALMFFICAWTNVWDTGDLRRHRTHYDVTAMN